MPMGTGIRIAENDRKSFFDFRNIEMFQFAGDFMYLVPFHTKDIGEKSFPQTVLSYYAKRFFHPNVS